MKSSIRRRGTRVLLTDMNAMSNQENMVGGPGICEGLRGLVTAVDYAFHRGLSPDFPQYPEAFLAHAVARLQFVLAFAFCGRWTSKGRKSVCAKAPGRQIVSADSLPDAASQNLT